MYSHQREWMRFTPDEQRAWIGMLRVHADLVARLDAELRADHGLTLSEYDTLIHLSKFVDPIRMGELADAVVLSRSGLSRLVERLERSGLVERQRASEDGREILASITSRGLRKLAEATPTHLEGVRHHFLEPLGAGKPRQLARAWRAVLAHLGRGVEPVANKEEE